MDVRTDILLDDDFQLLEDAENFDFIEGESDEQHVQLLCKASKGDFKENPHAGFGIDARLKQRWNEANFKRDLTVELELDKYINADIIIGASITDFEIVLNN